MRHPRDQRTRKAVWRGTTTGRHMFNADDVLLNPRVNMAYMCSKRPDLFDVGLVDYVQVSLIIFTKSLQALCLHRLTRKIHS